MNRHIIILFLLCLSAHQLIAQTDTITTKDTTGNALKFKALKDSTVIKDSTKAIADSLKPKPEKLIPIKAQTLLNTNEFNNTITQEKIEFSEYRNTADIINYYSPAFLRNLGTYGQPSELTIYGAGFDQISYLKDGLLINNRLTNSFDLNNVQSESIDSIEIIPAVRGFLYGSTNNLATVNFVSKEDFSIEGKHGGYSRLRYYQAADEEAFIDAIFSTNIYKKLTGHFEITNSTIGNILTGTRFQNSEYGSWQGNAKLSYPLSNEINITGNYNYSNSTTHLFGGVDVDSVAKMAEEPVSENGYPVNYLYRYYKNLEHNFYLKVLNRFEKSFSGEATFYSRYNYLQYRDNEYGTLKNEDSIVYNNKVKVLGFSLTENLNTDFVSFYVNSTYERSTLDTYYWGQNQEINSFSVASKINFCLIDSALIPSFFGKYLYQYSHTYLGIGGDATYHFTNNLSLYAGVSYFQKPFGFITNTNLAGYYPTLLGKNRSTNIASTELGMKFSQPDFLITLNVIYRKTKDELKQTGGETGIVRYLPIDKEFICANLGLNYQLWKFNLESSLSGYSLYYTIKSSSIIQGITTINSQKYQRYILPEYTFTGGIYYRDILFNNNLNLKTGIRVSSVGFQQGPVNEFDNSNLWEQNNDNRYGIFYSTTLHPSLTFDFVLIGEIQKRATIYFSLENLLDKKYFIVEGYYMPRRSMKLGVAWEFLN